MPIEIAAHAGFCMGVRRAVESAVQVADSGVPSCTLGELIHNPTVVDMLRQRGIPPVASAEEAAGRPGAHPQSRRRAGGHQAAGESRLPRWLT